MFGLVEYREVARTTERSREIIASGRFDWLCEDWSCPMLHHCGKHFGLSKRYAEMREMRDDEALVKPRWTGEDDCEFFVPATRDYFSESLGHPPRFTKILHPRNWSGTA